MQTPQGDERARIGSALPSRSDSLAQKKKSPRLVRNWCIGQETGRTTSPSELPRNWRGTGAPELARSARDQRECRSSNGSKNPNEHETIISSEMRAKRQVDALITVAHNTAARSWIERIRRHDGKSL